MTSLDLYGHPFAQCFTLSQNYRLPSEMQNDACLAYVQTGKQEVYSPTQKLVAQDGESILMKCGNYIANFTDITPTNEFKSVVFHLDPISIKKAFGDKDLSFLHAAKNKERMDPALKVDRSPLIDSFVESLMPYFNDPSLVSDVLLATKLQELVYILSDSGKNTIATYILSSLRTPEQLIFEEIVQANLYNNLSIPELAFLTSRSESSFKRDFKKYFGESPAKHIRVCRLERAAELLKNGSLQISEIAYDTGFENAAHFSTTFLNYFGKSPKNFRVGLI